MQIGYKLAAEAFGAAELIRQASKAEEVGFDFVEISDHFTRGSTTRVTRRSRGRCWAPSRPRPTASAWRPV